ncbi:MAG: hypothetical protein D4R67_02490 [Bacteroidetes bacterium]|nr:MAG: hypothetical protein D4R67_02490 [Bacteroidota bacterium]
MAFVSPLFLYGLFALAIPVLIHLIHLRRYKRIWFTNVRFLAEIKQERQKRSQLKQWILLAIRILAITSLVLAFAQPYIPSPLQPKRQNRQQGVSIYVDNSFSMEAVGSEGKLIETAKAKAREVAEAYRPSDRFQLLTNDFEGAHQRLVSREEFLNLLEEVRISPATRKLSEVVSRQQDLFADAPELSRNCYLISDFQESMFDADHFTPDTLTSFFIIPLAANRAGNLYIDTLFFGSAVQQPDQLSHLHVRIRNTGPDRLEKIPVKLVLNNRQKAVASPGIDARSETELVLSYTNELGGMQAGYVELPDYPITFDDRCYLSYPLVTSVSVLCINGQEENPYLNALFGNDSAFHFVNAGVNRLNYSSFGAYSLIILNQLSGISSGLIQELERFTGNGGSLLIILPFEVDRTDYRNLFLSFGLPEPGEPDTSRLRVSQIKVESQVYTDVFEPGASGRIELPENADLPVVTLHYPLPLTSGSKLEPLLILQNGESLLAGAPYGKGKVYLLTSPLDLICSSFPAHLLFVPTFYKIALLSQPAPNLYYFTATNKPVEVPSDTLLNDPVYRIISEENQFEMIPELKFRHGRMLLFPHDQIRKAGLYAVYRGAQSVTTLAFNFPRLESNLSCLTPEAIREALKRNGIRSLVLLRADKPSLSGEIRETERGNPLWKLFIILALVFLAMEIALLRLFPKQ